MASRNINSIKRWRTIWGILTLLSLAFICYGFTLGAGAYSNTVTDRTSEAGRAGAFLGAGIGTMVYLICGGIPFLLFLVFYLRAGGAVRSEQQHQEMLEAVKNKNSG